MYSPFFTLTTIFCFFCILSPLPILPLPLLVGYRCSITETILFFDSPSVGVITPYSVGCIYRMTQCFCYHPPPPPPPPRTIPLKHSFRIVPHFFQTPREKGRVAIWESTGSILLLVFLGRGWRGRRNYTVEWSG
jgi:hypothetical protein